MKIPYKKWFSILGLLAAILISLFIGLTFDLSVLEGAETMEKNIDNLENTNDQSDVTLADISDSSTSQNKAPSPPSKRVKFSDSPSTRVKPPATRVKDTVLSPSLAPSDSPSVNPPKKDNRRGQDVYKKVMDSPSTESFSILRDF